MNRREILRALAAASLLHAVPPFAAGADPMRVVFLNPGEPEERGTGPHWRTVSAFMAAAAGQLGIGLEVRYAERDHLRMLRQAEALAAQPDHPDYVVIVNEKGAGRQMLEILAPTPAKVMVIHNDLTDEQRREIGHERGRFPNWIGSLTADSAAGSYRLMVTLQRQLDGRDPLVIGITGDPATPVSWDRARGVEDFFARTGRGRTLQLVHGNWSYADGEEKARVLLARYPEANVIWAANDSMAMGALRAVQAAGAPVLVGGTGGWPDALESIAAGELTATVVGNFFTGAWALVLLHDYHHGRDFAERGGPRQSLDFLQVVDRSNVARFLGVLSTSGADLDFQRYSRLRHPASAPYDFALDIGTSR